MLRKIWPFLCCIGASIGCDAFPSLQLRLQSEIRHEYKITQALVMVMDTTLMMVMVFDDARAQLHPKELAAFQEDVAGFAVRHYTRGRVKTVGIVVSPATDVGREAPNERAEPTVFVPEYHPDGTVRMALLQRPTAIPAKSQPVP